MSGQRRRRTIGKLPHLVDASTTRGPDRLTRSTWLIGLVAVVVLGAGVPLTVAVVTGAVGHPHNDDFAYRQIAAHMAETGQFRLVDWGNMNLVGHAVWGALFVKLLG